MGSAREIKSRVKSIKNTQKVTRAMEMVSAAKMRRAVESVLSMRPFAHNAWSILANLSRAFSSSKHPLLEVRSVKKILLVVVASNRGLCGGFNAKIQKVLSEQLADMPNLSLNRKGKQKIVSDIDPNKVEVDILAVGRKAEKMARRVERPIVASFGDLMHSPNLDAVRPVAKFIIDEYTNKTYDKVSVIYTDYISPMVQEVKIRQIIPVSWFDLEKQIAEMDTLGTEFGLNEPAYEYKVEPYPERVLDVLLPYLVRMQLYHMVLESNASKEASRMLAMRNATEAAGEIAEDLTLAYNRIRQAKITQEIAEISAGQAALES